MIHATAINSPLRSMSSSPSNRTNTMPDILFLLITIGFFVLMLIFILACEKV